MTPQGMDDIGDVANDWLIRHIQIFPAYTVFLISPAIKSVACSSVGKPASHANFLGAAYL